MTLLNMPNRNTNFILRWHFSNTNQKNKCVPITFRYIFWAMRMLLVLFCSVCVACLWPATNYCCYCCCLFVYGPSLTKGGVLPVLQLRIVTFFENWKSFNKLLSIWAVRLHFLIPLWCFCCCFIVFVCFSYVSTTFA